MLTAYFDESGIHKGDHLCVIAGFVGNDAPWCSFAKEWHEALRPRPNLHMRTLRWKQHPERIGPLLARLGPIPYRYNLKPVYCGMWQRDYDEIVKGKLRERFTNPYMTCAQSCMAVALCEVVGSDEIAFVFDRQRVHKSAIQVLDGLVFGKFRVDSRVNGLTFLPRAATVCLDPADYLAFQIREYTLDNNSPKAKLGMSILLSGKQYGGIITREQLQERNEELIRFGVTAGGQTSVAERTRLFQNLMKNPYFQGPV
jgi:hypothetical protein